MVEDVEKLEAHPKLSLVPTGQSGVFHHRQISAEIVWAMKAIASLGKTHGRTTTFIRGIQWIW